MQQVAYIVSTSRSYAQSVLLQAWDCTSIRLHTFLILISYYAQQWYEGITRRCDSSVRPSVRLFIIPFSGSVPFA